MSWHLRCSHQGCVDSLQVRSLWRQCRLTIIACVVYCFQVPPPPTPCSGLVPVAVAQDQVLRSLRGCARGLSVSQGLSLWSWDGSQPARRHDQAPLADCAWSSRRSLSAGCWGHWQPTCTFSTSTSRGPSSSSSSSVSRGVSAHLLSLFYSLVPSTIFSSQPLRLVPFTIF